MSQPHPKGTEVKWFPKSNKEWIEGQLSEISAYML